MPPIPIYNKLANNVALTSKAWAEGTEPGGPGTKSAKGWSDQAAINSVNSGIIETDAFVVAQVDSDYRLLALQKNDGVWSGINYSSGITVYPPSIIETDVFSVVYVDENYREIRIIRHTSDIVDQVISQDTFALDTDAFLFASIDKEGRKLFAFEKDENNFVKWRDSTVAPPSWSYTVEEPFIGGYYLSGWRSSLTRLKLGGTGLAHIMPDADSWGDGKTYGFRESQLQFLNKTGLTDAGYGWIGLASATSAGNAIHLDNRASVGVSRTGSWTDLFRSADGTPGTPQNFPGYDAVRSTVDGSIYTVIGSGLANSVYLRLFCEKGSSIEYSWDGGSSYSTLTITSGVGSTYVDIPLVGKTSTLKLRCSNNSVISGLMHLSSLTGVVFSNFSSSGSTSSQKVSIQTNSDYIATMRALPGDFILVFPQLGLNDTKVNTPVETIRDNMAGIVSGYRNIYQGFPYCEFLLGCQPNTPLSVQDKLAPLLRTWTQNNKCAFIDWQPLYGIPMYSGDYSSYNHDYTSGTPSSALPYLQLSSSSRHPSRSTDLVSAGKSPLLNGADMTAGVLSEIFCSGV